MASSSMDALSVCKKETTHSRIGKFPSETQILQPNFKKKSKAAGRGEGFVERLAGRQHLLGEVVHIGGAVRLLLGGRADGKACRRESVPSGKRAARKVHQRESLGAARKAHWHESARAARKAHRRESALTPGQLRQEIAPPPGELVTVGSGPPPPPS
jgi:hypothetical protein